MTKLKYFFTHFEEILCSVFLVVMISLVIVNVFLRYLFAYSIFWAEEIATICFVWCVFVGASATYKHKMDMGIDLLITKTPPHIEKWVRFTTGLVLLTINGYIFYMGIVFTTIAWPKPTAVLGVSSAVFNLSLVVGFGLITFYTIRFLYKDIAKIVAQRKTRQQAYDLFAYSYRISALFFGHTHCLCFIRLRYLLFHIFRRWHAARPCIAKIYHLCSLFPAASNPFFCNGWLGNELLGH